jgi:protein SCO1/2
VKPLHCLSLAAVIAFAGCKREEPFEILQAPPAPTLQKYWQVPEFSFTERSGKPFSRSELANKVWIADFFYTECPGPCPMLSSRLSALQGKLANRSDVRLVSISLDPAKDTPAVLQQYANRFKAGPNWYFLTGDKAMTYSLVQTGFKLAVAEEKNNPDPITHSTKLLLIDRQGWVRGFYEGVGADQTEQLVSDVDKLLNEKP